jgi:hypothetical protein
MRWGMQHLQRACRGLVGYSKQDLSNNSGQIDVLNQFMLPELMGWVGVWQHPISSKTKSTSVLQIKSEENQTYSPSISPGKHDHPTQANPHHCNNFELSDQNLSTPTQQSDKAACSKIGSMCLSEYTVLSLPNYPSRESDDTTSCKQKLSSESTQHHKLTQLHGPSSHKRKLHINIARSSRESDNTMSQLPLELTRHHKPTQLHGSPSHQRELQINVARSSPVWPQNLIAIIDQIMATPS